MTAVPGPADRETFFAAQARHRRANWKLAAVCTLAIVLLGIPVAMVISPLVTGAAILLFDLVNLVVPMPNLLAGIGRLADALGGPGEFLFFYALVAIPGIAVVLPAWLAVRQLLFRGGVGGILLGLHARAPRADDIEERQLENVIGEMAVAAGVGHPKLRLLDDASVSAAAVGTGIDDATIVVSRGMLDRLDRAQTQAVMGHLVASTGNGDLRIAHLIVSVHATLRLIEALTFVAVSGDVRRRLRETFAAGRHPGALAAGEAERVSLALLNGLVDLPDGDPFDSHGRLRLGSGPPKATRSHSGEPTLRDRVVTVLVAPFAYTWMMLWLCRTAFLTLLTDPLTSVLWRRRRYLADASAVQLTRYPTALATALRTIGQVEAPLPGGPWASFLFAAGPRRKIGGSPIAGFGREAADLGVDCLPDPEARVERLRLMGAEVAAPGSKYRGPGGAFLRVWDIVFPILIGVVWAALFVLVVLATMLGFFMIPMCLMPVVGIPHLLLRWIGR